MMSQQSNSKIKSEHLDRKAVVYLRQSSQEQVVKNTESQLLQYALVERAHELGFERVEVIDMDLSSSASIGAKQREGFKSLIASIAVGDVGMVLSREVSRLSRTDRDWCRLQEVCQVFGVLVGDAERIYDLGQMDDQLALGIKATMSVVELNVLKLRLMEGMQAKARRGERIRVLMPKPPSGVGRKTSLEDLEIIRRMAVRYGDDEIARVLTKNGRRTVTGKSWNVSRVRAVRKRDGIEGRRCATRDPQILSLAQAAAHGGVSDTTIRRLIDEKLFKRNQVAPWAPWAPWEIRRVDLDEEPVRSILERVRETGKLELGRDRSGEQGALFP